MSEENAEPPPPPPPEESEKPSKDVTPPEEETPAPAPAVLSEPTKEPSSSSSVDSAAPPAPLSSAKLPHGVKQKILDKAKCYSPYGIPLTPTRLRKLFHRVIAQEAPHLAANPEDADSIFELYMQKDPSILALLSSEKDGRFAKRDYSLLSSIALPLFPSEEDFLKCFYLLDTHILNFALKDDVTHITLHGQLPPVSDGVSQNIFVVLCSNVFADNILQYMAISKSETAYKPFFPSEFMALASPDGDLPEKYFETWADVFAKHICNNASSSYYIVVLSPMMSKILKEPSEKLLEIMEENNIIFFSLKPTEHQTVSPIGEELFMKVCDEWRLAKEGADQGATHSITPKEFAQIMTTVNSVLTEKIVCYTFQVAGICPLSRFQPKCDELIKRRKSDVLPYYTNDIPEPPKETPAPPVLKRSKRGRKPKKRRYGSSSEEDLSE